MLNSESEENVAIGNEVAQLKRMLCNKRIKHSFPCINVCQAQGQ